MELGEHFLLRKAFSEHHAAYYNDVVGESELNELPKPIYFRGKKDCCCFALTQDRRVNNSYYIGADWITESKAVYVQPKLNRNRAEQVNYLAMLFEALKHSEVFEHTTDVFEIKWNQPEIKINQQHDMLTPLLVIQYLQVVKNIVRKGLKKSYYKVEHNLRSRVKGKVLVAQNIKQNLSKSKTINTFCAYDEFGYNGIENRVLKQALVFVERYLPTLKGLGSKDFFTHTFNFIRPAFEQVSAEASIRDCQHIKFNPFFKEYTLAINLAKQILRRFGYNIQNTSTAQVSTPPFWIDMSKLFELYVLGLLKDKYSNVGTIDFQFSTRGNKLDFLLNAGGYKMVVDAKYKLKYNYGRVEHEDIRQVSGYARLRKVYKVLNKAENEVIDCLIVYPDEEYHEGLIKHEINLNNKVEVINYVNVYKLPVKVPKITLK